MTDLLTVKNLRSGYGATVVIEDISFSVPERGTVAVLGRNGVGKTTLLASLMGQTTLHSGSIVFNGKPIEKLPIYERSRIGIGVVPQTRDIFPSLTVEENLTVAERPGRWTLQRVFDLFPRLAERHRHMGNQISGGEQQMLAIGRALMGSPSLLLMDEPMEGLAPIIVDALLLAMQRLIREDALTVILVEQSAKLALEVTDRALVLNRGLVAWEGKSSALLADPDKLASLFVAH